MPLPTNQRLEYALRSFQEIADLTGMTPKEVEKVYNNALNKLQRRKVLFGRFRALVIELRQLKESRRQYGQTARKKDQSAYNNSTRFQATI